MMRRAARRLVDRASALLPDRWAVRLLAAQYRYDAASLPPPIAATSTPVRLLVAPANYAAQGYAWARAAERLPGVGAVNMHVHGGGDVAFPADYSVDVRAFRFALRWGRAHSAAVRQGFTHVLYEAERPVLGRAVGLDVEREVALLREAGLHVAFVSHGSDLRRPSRHAAVDEWTPFNDATDPWVRRLEQAAARNSEMLDRVGAPIFVPTPELLLDRPGATWLPIVVDPRRGAAESAPLASDRRRPRVLHVPTSGPVKGTDLIDPVLARLDAEGVVEYVRRSGVAWTEMPALYRSVDVVLEQFRLGTYATTAIEAMAAGRLVVGHVRDQVREHVRMVSGLDLPVVQATAATVEQVLRDISARPDHYRETASRGPSFVSFVHDGRYSAEVLRSFLLPGHGLESASGGPRPV